jgi:hypothetical protein
VLGSKPAVSVLGSKFCNVLASNAGGDELLVSKYVV